MELKLERLIKQLETISQDRGLSPDNPVIYRLSHPAASLTTVIVVAHNEPYTQILPLNVTWFNMNPLSNNFRKALRRVSKTDPNDGTYNHTYETINTYAEVFVEQVYDIADEAIISSGSGAAAATVSVAGLVRVATTPQNVNSPVVVGDNDPRLSDARTPTAHSHPQSPAQQLATSTTNVTINNSSAPQVGDVLVATSSTTAVWRALTSNDIQ